MSITPDSLLLNNIIILIFQASLSYIHLILLSMIVFLPYCLKSFDFLNASI
jgi:hypothetical protein